MKKTSIVAFSLLSIGFLGGCTKNDLVKDSTGREMEFATHVDNTTKGEAKVEFRLGDQFALMATESATDWSNTDGAWYMGGGGNPVVVTNTLGVGGAGSWKYNPVKLWPDGNKVSFFAYSPVANGVNGISNVTTTTGSPTLDFVVNGDIKSQIDLLRAEALNKYDEEVQLTFSHALTRVTFAAKANISSNQRVRLDKIELQGIRNSGTLTLYDDTRVVGSLDDRGGWAVNAATTSYSPSLTHEAVSLVTTALMPMTDEDQALFMIPQSFTVGGAAKLAVTYSYSNDGGERWINNSQFEIDLGEYTQHWNPNKNYRYILTLSPENLYTFTADIVDWDAEIDVVVDNPFSTRTLLVTASGGAAPSEVTVTETRGEALGYTLKSTVAWITISDVADGTGAKGEVKYNPDGTVTKAYQMEKKWYFSIASNADGAPRTGYVEIIREGVDVVRVEINQAGYSPVGECQYSQSVYEPSVAEVVKMVVPDDIYSTFKLLSDQDWFTLSNDGNPANAVKELAITRKGDDQSFYVHTLSTNPTNNVRSGKVSFEITSTIDGAKSIVGMLLVRQDGHPNPLATAVVATIGADGGESAAYPITKVVLSKGLTYKISSGSDWMLVSKDGTGGAASFDFTPTTTGEHTFYTTFTKNPTASIRTAKFRVQTGENMLGSKDIKQDGHPNPLATAVVATIGADGGESAYPITKVALYKGLTYKISSGSDWMLVSKDGTGGAASFDFTPTTSGEYTFYATFTPNPTASIRTAKFTVQIGDAVLGTKDVLQSAHGNPMATSAVSPPAYYAPARMTNVVMSKGLTYVISCDQDWGLFSLDGNGLGTKSVTVTPSANGVVPLYVHAKSNVLTSSRNMTITIKVGSETVGTKVVTQTAPKERYLGRFAGAKKVESVGGETHYYYDKLLFLENAKTYPGISWQSEPLEVMGARSRWDGNANTVALRVTQSDLPGGCNNFGYYVPAQDQIMSFWITKQPLDSDSYWSSTEYDSSKAFSLDMQTGAIKRISKSTADKQHVRCVKEEAN